MDSMKPANRYHVLTQSVIPRPIAWVLTDNGTGEGDARYNLAPFSFFNVVASTPPLLVLGIHTKKSCGENKDTLVNIKERKLATIHIVTSSNFNSMLDSATETPFGESELLRENSNLTLCKYKNMLPHIKESPIAFFCELDHIHEVGESDTTSIVFCKILDEYINDDVVTNTAGNIIINPEKVNPISRLGLKHYSDLNKAFQVGKK